MSKNIMPEVLKMLGVEHGEKFKLYAEDCGECEDVLFAFNHGEELIKISPNGCTEYANGKLLDILNGYYEIVKLPWEPKEGERYFYPSISAKRVDCTNWIYCSFDYAMKALGMVYKTLEEAQECFADDYEKLTGKKLE